ncbi:MAG TPA: hypothetical protein VML75_20020 [Kofleriaceae bacterium]|nr:hypothetical protein [Kofleriaceae bacterium]
MTRRACTLWPLAFVALGLGCKPKLSPTEFERISSEACECSIEKPGRALRLDKIVKDVDLAYGDLRTELSVGVSAVLREDLEDLSLREFADFMVEAMRDDPDVVTDEIKGCDELEVDGRPALICGITGELTHMGLVKTPKRLLAVVISVDRTPEGSALARRIFGSLRSTEPPLSADAVIDSTDGEDETL